MELLCIVEKIGIRKTSRGIFISKNVIIPVTQNTTTFNEFGTRISSTGQYNFESLTRKLYIKLHSFL